MYELLAICICTSCLSCICCFLTGALCVTPKIIDFRRGLTINGQGNNMSQHLSPTRHNEPTGNIPGGHCNDEKCPGRKWECACAKKIIVHTLPIPEEQVCGIRKRDACSCRPLKMELNNH